MEGLYLYNMSSSGLVALPVELLHKIFSHLTPVYLNETVRLVCKRFARILTDDSFWKLFFRLRYGMKSKAYQFPLLPHLTLHECRDLEPKFRCGTDLTWRELTSRTDKRDNFWGPSGKLNSRINGFPHSSVVDTVKIIPNHGIFISGGRDKMMCLWDLDYRKNALVLGKENVHTGWVWDIAYCGQDQFFTSGWDSTVKSWSFFEQLTCFKVMKTPAPAMCLDVIPGLLVAGLLTPDILLFDPRVAIFRAVHRYIGHSRAVTSLKINGNRIYSVSEDKSLSIYDVRSLSVIEKRKLVLDHEEAFPRKIAIFHDLMYMGDSRGSFHIYNIKFQDWEPIITLKVGNERPVNAIIPSLEGVIVGTSDDGAKMVVPCEPMKVIKHFDVEGAEVTSMDFYQNHLVMGTTNSESCVHLYSPMQDP